MNTENMSLVNCFPIFSLNPLLKPKKKRINTSLLTRKHVRQIEWINYIVIRCFEKRVNERTETSFLYTISREKKSLIPKTLTSTHHAVHRNQSLYKKPQITSYILYIYSIILLVVTRKKKQMWKKWKIKSY